MLPPQGEYRLEDGPGIRPLRATIIACPSYAVALDLHFPPPPHLVRHVTRGAPEAASVVGDAHLDELHDWLRGHTGPNTTLIVFDHVQQFEACRMIPPKRMFDVASHFAHSECTGLKPALESLVDVWLNNELRRNRTFFAPIEALACYSLFCAVLEQGNGRSLSFPYDL